MGFNPDQLTTFEEAVELATKISTGTTVVGKGVAPLTNDSKTSGIYLPEWEAGPAAFPQPFDGDSKHFHFRMNNGVDGVNCGLVRDRFKRYPEGASDYVLRQLNNEIEATALQNEKNKLEGN